jgi:hypothetical protein
MSLVAYGYAIVPVGGAVGTQIVGIVAVEIETIEIAVEIETPEITVEVN